MVIYKKFCSIKMNLPTKICTVTTIRFLDNSNEFDMTDHQLEGYFDGGHIWFERNSFGRKMFGVEVFFVNISQERRK